MTRRRLANIRAVIRSTTGEPLAECDIRDVSQGGARLVFKGLPQLPAEIVLAPAGGGAGRKVRVVWVAEHQAGVAYMRDDAGR